MNIGIVGCGRVTNHRHLPALARLPAAQVVALADVDADRLERTAQRFGVERRYSGPEELLADPKVAIVCVCVPPAAHAEVAVAALEAGKHVFVEKPLALEPKAARAIVAAADENSGCTTLGFNLRHHRLVARARELILGGALGELQTVHTTFTSSFDYREGASPWRLQPELGGSALIEMGAHHLDQWRHLTNREAEHVSAVGRSGRDPDEGVTIVGRLEGDVIASSVISQHSTNTNRFEAYGSLGALRLDCYRYDGLEIQLGRGFGTSMGERLQMLARTLRELPAMAARARAGGDYLVSYVDQWQTFFTSIDSGRPPAATLEDGLRNVELLAAARESLASGSVTVTVRSQTRGKQAEVVQK